MYIRVLNYLRGSVRLQCDSTAPERVLNLCAVHGIPFWDVRWQTAERFTLRTTRQGAARLEAVAAETGAALHRLEEHGAPLTLRRMRRRYVLWAALGLVLALAWYGGSFIWGFQVSGNHTVPTEEILRVLERNGVSVGTRSLSFDQETLRNHALLELDDLSWLTVNVKGCTAYVQVVERKRPPQPVPSGPANAVAACDGVVTQVEALDGHALVKKGDTVQAGQLLISGVRDGTFGGVRFMTGMGRVYARTWHTLTAAVPLTGTVRGETQTSDTTLALDVGKHRIKICGRGSMLGAGCDRITVYQPLTLPFGLRLPLTLVREEVTCRAVEPVRRTAAQAEAEGQAQLLHQLAGRLSDGDTVTHTQFSTRQQGDTLLVTLVAECRQQIAVSVPIQVDMAP